MMKLISQGHSATSALFERDDVIIVASVSCIYGLGSPEEYRELVVSLRVGMEKDRNQVSASSLMYSMDAMILIFSAERFAFAAMS